MTHTLAAISDNQNSDFDVSGGGGRGFSDGFRIGDIGGARGDGHLAFADLPLGARHMAGAGDGPVLR